MRVTQPGDRFEFAWKRSVEGFHWVDQEGSRGRTMRYLVPSGVQTETIQPLKSPELLRRFADLEATEEAILAFANSYGLLDRHEPSTWGVSRPGDSLEAWEHEIELVRAVVGIWDCVAEGDRRGLKKWLSLDGRGVTYMGSFTDSSGPLSGKPFHLGSDAPSDLLDVAAEIVALLINFHFADDVDWWHIRAPGERRLETFSEPNNLRAAIWSQLSQLTRGGADQRRCRQCGTWFTIAVGRKRSDSLFDRDACKSKAYRTRKAAAIRMRKQGIRLTTIAKTLDTDLAVVRGWIGPTKRKPKPKTTVDRLRARHRRKLKARAGG